MAELDLDLLTSVDASTSMFATQVSGLYAGADMLQCTFGQITKVGNRVSVLPLTTGFFAGMTGKKVRTGGHGVTLLGIGTRFSARAVAKDLIPGNIYYLGSTATKISDAATAKDAQGAFLAVTESDLEIIKIGKVV